MSPQEDVDFPAPSPQSRWGKGFLALAGNILITGLGHVIVGRPRRGLVWFSLSFLLTAVVIAAMVTPRLLPILIGLLPVYTIVMLTSYIDSFLCGRHSMRKLAGPFWRYAGGVGLIALTCVTKPGPRVAEYLKHNYVEAFRLAGGSMIPTINTGDRFLMHKKSGLKRWDLVVMTHPEYDGAPIATRIVGLPGERVEIIAGEVHINGKPLTSPPGAGPYTQIQFTGAQEQQLAGRPCTACEGNPLHLGDEEYFVLGDNSPRARDARLWEIVIPGHPRGALPADQIFGRVTAIYWPPRRWRLFE